MPELIEIEEETLCEVCQRGDREHLLLLCDSCDRGYHTTCLATPLSHVPRGRWYCDTCARVQPAAAVTRPRARDSDGVITRTGHLERIRAAVNAARAEIETRFATYLSNNRPARRRRTVKRKTRSKKSSKSSKKGKRGRCRTSRAKQTKVSGAIVDNVRRALGINDAVYSERPVPLTLFGDYNQLDPGGDQEEETEDPLDQGSFSSSAGGGGVATRVMPRHLAVQRMNLARRRRNKLGAAIPDPAPANTAVDILGGIIRGGEKQ